MRPCASFLVDGKRYAPWLLESINNHSVISQGSIRYRPFFLIMWGGRALYSASRLWIYGICPRTSTNKTRKSQWERLRIELRLPDYEPDMLPLHYPPSKCLVLCQDPRRTCVCVSTDTAVKAVLPRHEIAEMTKNLPRAMPWQKRDFCHFPIPVPAGVEK
jgi:hypothetical protein